MAGGMTPGGEESLQRRVDPARARAAGHSTLGFHGREPASWADALSDAGPPKPAAPPIKHCFYDGPHGRQAALLLGWRNVEGGYDGRIVVAALEPDGWAVVEMWVGAGMLSPARA